MNHINPKIFIVEDDTFYAEIIAYELRKNGFENVQVFNSGESFESSLHQMPDIILLDYHLGDTNGVGILKKIKAFNPNIQVIFLSGQNSMTVALDSLKYGAYDYLKKEGKSLVEMVHLIDCICVLNKEMSRKKKRYRLYSKIKKVAITISLFLVLLFLLGKI